jgi:hypothetical protein
MCSAAGETLVLTIQYQLLEEFLAGDLYARFGFLLPHIFGPTAIP